MYLTIILIFLIYFIVFAICGNKDDLYENEQVDEEEAKKLAEDLNAIFQKISAKSSNGIEDSFIKIGKKFLDPKSDGPISAGNINTSNTSEKERVKENIKLNKKGSDGKQKKGCC